MARQLEQEVNLSRRGCWKPNDEATQNSKLTKIGSKSHVSLTSLGVRREPLK